MIPLLYCSAIAQRCLHLIHRLRPIVSADAPHDLAFGGPLTTTFLLAMAGPMVILPIERMFKPSRPNSPHAGDERALDPNLGERIGTLLGSGCIFGDAPFVVAGQWSYVSRHPTFNVAEAWPLELLDELSSQQARHAANSTPASRILIDLRNALAHGGLAYLDEHGQQTDSEAAMIAFASAVIERNRVVALNILRIREDDFRMFLEKWGEWLNKPAVRAVLDEIDPLGS